MNTKYIEWYVGLGRNVLVCGDHYNRIALYITHYMDVGMYHYGGGSPPSLAIMSVYKTVFVLPN